MKQWEYRQEDKLRKSEREEVENVEEINRLKKKIIQMAANEREREIDRSIDRYKERQKI